MTLNSSTQFIKHRMQPMAEFNWFEYLVFFGMLGASALIGVYFGCLSSTKDTVAEYMLGGRRMPTFPIALSLIASCISGITLLGLPAETYIYGTQLYLVCLAIVISTILLNIFYLPILYHLESPSIFEYLERRFNFTVRSIGSLLCFLSLILYIPVVIYVPSLAFNQVTGMPMYILAPTVCAICIFYTTLGGLKAVVWSDALQSMFTVASLVAINYLGLQSVGGTGNVLQASKEGERIEFFNFDPDPFKRNTFWTVVIGSTVTWVSFLALHPGAYQRYVALPSYNKAKLVIYAMAAGLVIVKTGSTFSGLIIYTKYHDCDPVITKEVEKVGQILPYFVMDVAGYYRGLTGLFLSGVVSTALSTMSTGLNSIACTMFEDFIKPALPWNPSDRQSNLIMKAVVIFLGFVSSGLVFVVANMGTILQVAITLNGVTTGITTFIFSFGMFIPWANSKGAVAGSLAGFATVLWIALGAQLAASRGDITFPGKVTSIDQCPVNKTLPEGLNYTTLGNPGYGTLVNIDDSIPMLYRISYLHFSTIGLFISLLVGLIVSIITGGQDLTELDPKLIIPQLRWLIPHAKKNTSLNSVDKYTPVATQEFHMSHTNGLNRTENVDKK